MGIRFPQEAQTEKDKIEFCYAAQEKLRLEHNGMGKKFRDGDITEIQWKKYREVFDTKNLALCEEMNKQKDAMKKSTRFTVDLENLQDGS